MKSDIKLLFSNLSTSMYFAELQKINWPEIDENDWRIVLPDTENFGENETRYIVPSLGNKELDEANIRDELTAYFTEIAEYFLPKSCTCFYLKMLPVLPEYAQAILFRTQNPCRVVLYKSQPVLVVPDDICGLTDIVARAFFLIGYLPPMVVQHFPHEFDNAFNAEPRQKGHMLFRRYAIAVITEYLRLSEFMK